VFFDSLAFVDDDGLALGDPMADADGTRRFALLVTGDGGRTWQDVAGPTAEAGEAAFAASNGCIARLDARTAVFASSAGRAFRTSDGGASWTSAPIAIAGSASAGPFAIAFRYARVGYAIGGDYAAPTAPGGFARTSDGGVTWSAGAPPRGYRSSIAIADG